MMAKGERMMSKVYQCDSCGQVTDTPHEEKMKEFYIGAEFTEYGVFPCSDTRKVKIHLCPTCYKGLKAIGLNSIQEKRDVVKVVRCKDCKYFSTSRYCTGESYTGCTNWGTDTIEPCNENDFCSYGERRTDNGTSSDG